LPVPTVVATVAAAFAVSVEEAEAAEEVGDGAA
jgi:hypothetical protein